MTMRNILMIPAVLAAALLFCRPAAAQGSNLPPGTVTLNFFNPATVDPTNVTFFNTNPISVNGSDIAPDTGVGLEIHSQIPNDLNSGFQNITSLEFMFHYDGMVDFASNSTPAFTAWLPAVQHDATTDVWRLFFTAQPGSAPINDAFDFGDGQIRPSFADATITGNSVDLDVFRLLNANGGVVITPNAVPEFGSLFSLGGLLAVGGAGLWVKGRRRAA
jgi:hypothetical protein